VRLIRAGITKKQKRTHSIITKEKNVEMPQAPLVFYAQAGNRSENNASEIKRVRIIFLKE
jgi:hypothetical protein